MQHIALTVDDDHQTLFFLEQVLRPFDVHILQAEDGAEAIALLKQETPNILFLDMMLPKRNGLDVLKYVLDTPRLNNMAVVVISAHEHFEPSQELNRVDAYFVKPVRLQPLREVIQQVISRQATP
jgi:CheY-like chemotaxis protein